MDDLQNIVYIVMAVGYLLYSVFGGGKKKKKEKEEREKRARARAEEVKRKEEATKRDAVPEARMMEKSPKAKEQTVRDINKRSTSGGEEETEIFVKEEKAESSFEQMLKEMAQQFEQKVPAPELVTEPTPPGKPAKVEGFDPARSMGEEPLIHADDSAEHTGRRVYVKDAEKFDPYKKVVESDEAFEIDDLDRAILYHAILERPYIDY